VFESYYVNKVTMLMRVGMSYIDVVVFQLVGHPFWYSSLNKEVE